jgi:transposase, IS30 family
VGREAVLSPKERRRVRRLAREGLSHPDIARIVGRSRQTVTNVMDAARSGVPSIRDWDPEPGHLGIGAREEISRGLRAGETFTEIAGGLGVAVSTVSREVARNGGRSDYRAWRAHKTAFARSRRPKPTKLASCPRLRDRVAELLVELLSPEQIQAQLRREFPSDPIMRVSHETIYQSLYVQGRGELRRELARCLRTGRTQRKHHGRLNKRGVIPDMVNISERPPEIEDRAVPGHWEGDLIMGADNRSAVGTLVERHTRYVMLLHLPDGHGPTQVRDAMIKAIQSLPEQLRGSITWDQGLEMGKHRDFSIATGVDVYFCDPHSPWQRGSNENTNGLLRQYMPKSTDLRQHSAADLERFARSLNNRPRKTLGWMTPSEKLAEVLLAPTG